MEWKLSQKRRKILVTVIGPTTTYVITFVVLFLLGALSDKNVVYYIITTVLFIETLLWIIAIKGSKSVEGWNYPLIVRIEDNELKILKYNTREQRYVNDWDVPIEFDKIYKVIVKDKAVTIYHIYNGKRYYSRMTLSGFISGAPNERRKRQEILREILKRIDKNNVEIIDKRRK